MIDKLQIEPRVGTIDFIANKWVAEPLRVSANLVLATCFRHNARQRETTAHCQDDQKGQGGKHGELAAQGG